MWNADSRLSIFETVGQMASEKTKFLFYPCLVRKKPLFKTRYTENNRRYYVPDNYNTEDVTYARCLWVDIDGHKADLTTEQLCQLTAAAVKNLLEMLPTFCDTTGMPMPAVVVSGRGVHLYWWFTEAVGLLTGYEKITFKEVLKAANKWASKLLENDSVCAAAWDADKAVAAIHHQMNLPGTVNPKTKTPRYVANVYGKNYFKYDYSTLLDALKPFSIQTMKKSQTRQKPVCEAVPIAEVEEPPRPDKCTTPILPTEIAIPVELEDPKTKTQVRAVVPSAFARNSYARGRVNRLIAWAAGRGWQLTSTKSSSGSQREDFLFACGSLLAMESCDALEELHDINQQLSVPLGNPEVDKIIKELTDKAENGETAWERYYCYSNDELARFLDMTPEEKDHFMSGNGTGEGYRLPNGGYFGYVFRRVQDNTTPLPGEDDKTWRQRCFYLALQEIRQNDTRTVQEKNAARDQRRKKKREQKKANELAQCQSLREQGHTLSQIAEATGFSLSKVKRILRGASAKTIL